MTISAPPTAPDPSDPSTFNARATAWVGWWTAAISEINSLSLMTNSGQFTDGTAALPGIAFALDTDTGISRSGANQLSISTGGVLRVLLSTTAFQVSVPITGTAPTLALGNNSTSLATTAFVAAGLADLMANAPLTGVPSAPTAVAGTNTTQLATTAFAAAAAATAAAAVKAASQPIATAAVGLGQFFLQYTDGGIAMNLPAGGTWAYFITGYTSSGTLDTGGSAGVAAGGSQIGAAAAGRRYNAMIWKIQ